MKDGIKTSVEELRKLLNEAQDYLYHVDVTEYEEIVALRHVDRNLADALVRLDALRDLLEGGSKK